MIELLDQLKRHEGFRGAPYLCTAGKVTIGYGRNLEANPMTEEEAELLLVNDVDRVIGELRQHIDLKQLTPARQAVLINMCFNLGLGGLLKFRNMWAAINREDWQRAADEMLDSRWAQQVGRRAQELAQQMEAGRFPHSSGYTPT